MVKLFTQNHTYEHSWENVSAAFWRKYPNPLAPHVREVDVYDRNLNVETGKLSCSRLIACKSAIPGWLSALGASDLAFAAETTIVDPSKREMVVKSKNITGSSLFVVEETCTYKEHPENKNWTAYKQEAKITAFMPMVSGRIEGFGLSNMTKNSGRGLTAIEMLCQRVQEEGKDSLHSILGTFDTLANTIKTKLD